MLFDGRNLAAPVWPTGDEAVFNTFVARPLTTASTSLQLCHLSKTRKLDIGESSALSNTTYDRSVVSLFATHTALAPSFAHIWNPISYIVVHCICHLLKYFTGLVKLKTQRWFIYSY